MLEAWINLHPALFVGTYLLIGFIIGIVILKWPGAKSESPVGTLLLAMFAWGPASAVGLPIFVVVVVAGWFLALIGVETHQGDSHGV